jgi:NAD(P)-dependent dehydrogenase (short-subunit alcohol dehydrogenase family)
MGKRRTIVITGASSGIGKTVALNAGRNGHRLVLVCRNPEKGKLLLEELASYPNASAEVQLADLGKQSDIKRLSQRLHDNYTTIDILINNAGFLGMPEFTLSEDGVELTIATNFLSQFILSLQLLDLLRKSEAPQIINVGSAMYKYGKRDFDQFNQPENYKPLMKYADSKFLVTLFTGVLAQKLTPEKFRINCVDPGTANTNIAHSYGKFFRTLYWIASPFMRSPEKGAATLTYLINNEHGATGKLWKDRKVLHDISDLYTLEETEKLWKWSLDLTGVSDPTI